MSILILWSLPTGICVFGLLAFHCGDSALWPLRLAPVLLVYVFTVFVLTLFTGFMLTQITAGVAPVVLFVSSRACFQLLFF